MRSSRSVTGVPDAASASQTSARVIPARQPVCSEGVQSAPSTTRFVPDVKLDGLDQVVDAHRHLESNTQVGKIVLRPGGAS